MKAHAAAHARAEAAIQAIMNSFDHHGRATVVDSPPGAGKTTLVSQVAQRIADRNAPLAVITQTNEQVDDLIDRIARQRPDLPIGRLSARDYVSADRVAGHASVRVATKITDLADRALTIGTAAKWASASTDEQWPWAIIDEAYQMRSDLLLRVAGRFDKSLFVGDPGQLDPFSTVDSARWQGLSWDPTLSAISVLLRHNPDTPVHRLPVSWRLPASAAPPVAAAFYPYTPFEAGTTADQRRMRLKTHAPGRQPSDHAIETAAETGWAYYELPARHTPRADAETARVCAALAERLLQRGTVTHCERNPSGTALTPERIAIGTAHRDQAAAVRAQLGPATARVVVDTANRLQGREYDVTIVWHPLSGRRDATAFHLESGRLCVLASRHRHACIVVARAGIPQLLDAHPTVDPVHLNAPVKFPDGWEANQEFISHLARFRTQR